MADAAQILKDPDFINANPATKQAIFARHVENDPDYKSADAATQSAIRARFGFESQPSLPPVIVTAPRDSEIPAPRREYSAAEVPGQMVRNLPSSAKRFAGGLYEAVTNPLETAKGVLDIGAGAIQKVLPQSVVDWVNQFEANPEAGRKTIEAANAAGGMLKDRYGSYEAIKRTLAEDPVGAVADLSTLLTAGAGGLRATANVAPRVAPAAAAVERAATLTNPLSVVTVPAQKALAAKERVMPGELAKQKERNAVRDATLRAAQAEGYMVTPGSVTPQGRNIVAERMAGKTNLEQLMSVNNQDVTNKLARRAVGIDETAPLTSENMGAIRAAEYEKGYKPIERIGEVPADMQYLDDMIQVESKYTGPGASFPGAVPDEVTKLIKTYTVDKFNSKDAVQAIRNLRDDARANFRKNENATAKAQLDIANALENQIERAIAATPTPNADTLLQQFRLSRQRMAISHTIEDAIREGGGAVEAKKLARDLQSGKYLSGDLKTAAEFANVFPRVSKTAAEIGTPAAGTMMGAPSGFGGVMGGILGGIAGEGQGAVTGGMLGAYAPQMVSAAMRNYLMSQGVQNRLIPTYESTLGRLASDVTARNALLAAQAGNIAQPNRNELRR
jgi:hypothetical protein